MAQKKTIAIIGATGAMGSAIARSLSTDNHHLLLMGKDPSKLAVLSDSLANSRATIDTITCPKEASWEADIIVVATPYEAEKEVAESIRAVASGKIVISISNPLNSDYSDLLTAHNTSAAEELQHLLPYSKVVKAFNTTFAADFVAPVIDGKTTDAFIAGNSAEAVDTVAELVRTAGFNPVTVGDLTMSRVLERMQLLLIRLTIKHDYNWHAGWKILHH